MPHSALVDGILAEMQTHVWAMYPKALDALVRQIAAMRAGVSLLARGGVITNPKTAIIGESDGEGIIPLSRVHAATGARAQGASRMRVANGTAMIPITGPLMKSVPWIFEFFGIAATSFSQIRADLEQALGAEDVDSILFHVESPGGQVGGTEELGELMRAAGKVKPTSAFIDDIGASGAYWLASQAGKITANSNAMVGSIGVYTVYVDASKMAAEAGLEVKVIRSGDHKGMGVMGAPITEAHVAAMQDVIDGMAENFIQAVSLGRGKKTAEIKALADGRVWIAKEAMDLGLVDQVGNIESALAGLRPTTRQKEKAMDPVEEAKLKASLEAAREEERKKAQARVAEIQAAFPDDVDFAMKQIATGATLAEAKVAFCEVLQERNAALTKENADLAKGEGKPTPKPRGAKPVGHGTPAEGGGTFMEQATALCEEKEISMVEAMSRVARKNPGLYQEHKEREESLPKVTRTRG